MRLFLSILAGCVLAFGGVVLMVFSSAAPDEAARQLVAWCVGHFLWLQDQGVTTIAFHNWLYREVDGAGMTVLVFLFYGFLIGSLIWLLWCASASSPRKPDVREHGENPTPPEGHGYYHGLGRGGSR